ncbi:hypothetical protein NLI96_g130 [Meripilus lineatus]|uniref:Uncharacterized protein n=1 Tax=Meripilus lineatus TaxID=2056292 RepID=A0AAD5VIH5_9APHY|nr:hypothetical protein NLI96_g130 [Physisporinus lineatus]
MGAHKIPIPLSSNNTISRLGPGVICRGSHSPINERSLKKIRGCIRQLVDEHLDSGKKFEDQPEHSLKQIETICLRRFPDLTYYEDRWPINLLVRRRLYDIVRKRNQKTKALLEIIEKRLLISLSNGTEADALRLCPNEISELHQALEYPFSEKATFSDLVLIALANTCLDDAVIPTRFVRASSVGFLSVFTH